MPPRKNLEKGRVKSQPEKTPRKVAKKPKPKLKEPSIVKAKLIRSLTAPSSPATPKSASPKCASPKSTSPKCASPNIASLKSKESTPKRCTRAKAEKKPNGDAAPKLNKCELKVILANEVVRTVFQKSTPVTGSEEKDEGTVPTVKKKGRSKKLSSKLQDYNVEGIRPRRSASVGKPNENIQDVSKKKATQNGTPVEGRTTRKRNLIDSVAGDRMTDDTDIVALPEMCTPKRRKLVAKKTPILTPAVGSKERTRVLRNTRGKQREKEAIAPEEDAIATPSNKPVDAAVDKQQSQAEPISCRKKSFCSTSTCFSWTKDISSSSTTTCYSVQSNDFVRIDNRLPIIKITSLNHKPNTTSPVIQVATDNNDALSIAESTRISASNSHQISVASIGDLNVPDLDLSTSSLSTERSTYFTPDASIRKNADIIKKLKQSLDDCSSKMKSFDLEMINWIGYDNDRDIRKIRFHDRILKELKHENDVIMHCKQIKRILTGEDSAQTGETIADENEPDTNMETQTSPQHSDEVKNNATDKLIAEQNKETVEQERLSTRPLDDADNDSDHKSEASQAIEKLAEMENNDDDDALSLYAESLTGLDSSRRNTSAGSDQEEYIPRPISNDPMRLREVITYEPTATDQELSDQSEPVTDKPERTKAICEKQTADSTSIYREVDENRDELSKSSSMKSPGVDQTGYSSNTSQCTYSQSQGVKSGLFHGVCFINLISNCNKPMCTHPHVQLEIDDVKSKLIALDYYQLLQECLIVRNLPALRQKYGMCFIEECARRGLTKLLIETAMYFIVKSDPTVPASVALTVEAAESMLLYLNGKSLSTFAQDLDFPITADLLMCDYLMEVISKTQNFSRFKPVFLKLTLHIRQRNRKVSLEVVSNLLERFCILPYDSRLMQAFVELLRRTDVRIWLNPMIQLLEKQLSMNTVVLLEEVMRLKEQHVASGASPPASALAAPAHTPPDTEARYSPDTTNLDSLTKSADEPAKTGAVNCNRTLNFNPAASPAKQRPWAYRPRGAYARWNDTHMCRPPAAGYSGYYRGWPPARARARARGLHPRGMLPAAYAGTPSKFSRGRPHPKNMY